MQNKTMIRVLPRRHSTLVSLTVAGVFAFASLSFAQVKEATQLKSAITAERNEFRASEALTFRFTLTNTSGAALNVLKWETPLEGFTADIFSVDKGGTKVPYIGKLVKRGAPTPEDYVSIGPGQSVSSSIDLAEGYAISEPGQYTVEFNSAVLDYGEQSPSVLAGKRELLPKMIRSNSVSFRVLEGRSLPPQLPPPPPGAAGKQPAFQSCSQTQQPPLTQGLLDADTITVGASLALRAVSDSQKPNCARYKTWFGTYDANRWNTVLNHYDKVHDALANKTVTFHCDCNQNWYAYVYPNQPYHIWVCNAFWGAPAMGTDSKAGTIVHETTHFNAVASTQDYTYGQANCKNLAISDPAKAIQNADSHEYFAENTPAQKCGMEQIPVSLLIIALAVAGDRLIRKSQKKTGLKRNENASHRLRADLRSQNYNGLESVTIPEV